MNESKTGRCQHVTSGFRITRVLTDYAQKLPGHCFVGFPCHLFLHFSNLYDELQEYGTIEYIYILRFPASRIPMHFQTLVLQQPRSLGNWNSNDTEVSSTHDGLEFQAPTLLCTPSLPHARRDDLDRIINTVTLYRKIYLVIGVPGILPSPGLSHKRPKSCRKV